MLLSECSQRGDQWMGVAGYCCYQEMVPVGTSPYGVQLPACQGSLNQNWACSPGEEYCNQL